MRRAAKRDLAEPAIVSALRDAGYWVSQISHKGFPDLVVGHKGYPPVVLMEVKTDDAELTDDQLRFWTDTSGSLRFIVRSPEEALQICNNWIRNGYDPHRQPD